jgi:Ca2+-binding EF-hand superfamily protein
MNYDELMEILGPMTIIKKNFLVFDADKSGTLDFQEMRKLIDTISIEFQIPKFTDSQLTGLMVTNDKNHDDIVTFDELFLLILPIFCNKTPEKSFFFSTNSAFGRVTA